MRLTRGSQNTQPPELRFRAVLGWEPEVELDLVWSTCAPCSRHRLEGRDRDGAILGGLRGFGPLARVSIGPRTR